MAYDFMAEFRRRPHLRKLESLAHRCQPVSFFPIPPATAGTSWAMGIALAQSVVDDASMIRLQEAFKALWSDPDCTGIIDLCAGERVTADLIDRCIARILEGPGGAPEGDDL